MNKKCCDVRFKIVMTDINMPLKDGWDLTYEVISLHKKRNQFKKDYKELSVVGISAGITADCASKVKNSGMKSIYAKPMQS